MAHKLLFFVSEDWFFVSHFLPIAKAAQSAGFDVAVATRVASEGDRILAAGCRVIPLDVQRASTSAFQFARELIAARRIVRAERPDVVHCIALRVIVTAGFAAKLAGVGTLVLAPTGLGHVWTSKWLGARVVRALTRFVVARVLDGSGTRYLFENRDDPAEFGLDPEQANVTIVPGAGVDPAAFPLMPEPPAPPVRFALVSRMLRSKGIAEAAEAIGRARLMGAPAELDIYGTPDPANPAAFTEAELAQLSLQPGVKWHGRVNDVAAVWREHHVALLLTEREGMPRSLVEAAACGRPIIATDVVGCREVVRDGDEGLLVPLGDIDAAALAIATLANDRDLRLRLGAAAYARFLERFTEDKVRDAVRSLYLAALSGTPSTAA